MAGNSAGEHFLAGAPALRGYRILREIGRGGMGLIYEAIQTSLGRRVAIKELSGFDQKMVERFRREASILARLGDHEHIVQVFDVIEDEAASRRYIVMEFVDGQTLARVLGRRGRLERAEAARVAIEASSALGHAHDKGVVHRDVKPSNIMLNERGVVKVMDFGIARALEESPITLTGQTLGTPAYMSPEQAQGDSELDGRSDLYSLTVALYETLCGRTPFKAPNPLATLRMHLQDEPPPPSRFHSVIPPEWDAAILKGLAKKPDDRYRTAAEFRAALESLLGAERTLGPFQAAAGVVNPSTGESPRLTDGPRTQPTPALLGVWSDDEPGQTIAGATTRVESPDYASDHGPDHGPDRPFSASPSESDLPPPASAALFSRLFQKTTSGDARRLTPTLSLPDTPSPEGASRRARKLARLAGPATDVAFSPDGRLLLSASDDGKLRLWDWKANRETLTLSASETAIRRAAFSAGGGRVVSGALDGTIRVWDWRAESEKLRIDSGGGAVCSVAFSPDGTALLAGLFDGTIRLWEVETGREMKRLRASDDSPASAVFSADGERILSGSYDGTIRLWEVASGRELMRLGMENGARVASAAISPEGRRALSGGADRLVHLWSLESGREISVWGGHEDWVSSVAFSPDGARALSAGRDKKVWLWDLKRGAPAERFEGHGESVARAVFSPDGLFAATAGKDGLICLWELPIARAE
jgi:serine/threonine protein kinase